MIPWEDDFGKLSKNQEEFIVGCLLGDGRLESRSFANTARLRIHHSDSQRDYLFWKFEKLKNLTKTIPRRHEYIDKRYNKKVVSWYFHTKTFISFAKLYKMFYKNGRKNVPVNLEKILTPYILAVWIMDDGCLNKGALILNTQSFSMGEHRYMQSIFNKKYGVKTGIHKDRKNFRLYFPKQSAKIIQNIISPFLFGPKFIPVETDPRLGGVR